MAGTPSASNIPAAVAQFRSCESGCWLDLVSMVRPAAAAAWRAVLIWAEVSGRGVWMSQPARSSCNPGRSTVWTVIRLFGADV
jgi:hypothetical protein